MAKDKRRLAIRVRDRTGQLQSLDVCVRFSAPTTEDLDEKWERIKHVARSYLRAGLRDELMIELGKTPRHRFTTTNLETGDNVSLHDIWRTFIEIELPKNSPAERASKRTIWRRHIEPVLGDRQPDTLTSLEIESWRSSLLRKGLSHKTSDNCLCVLRVLLRWAVKHKLLTANPAENVSLLKQQDVESNNYLLPDEIEKLLGWAKDNLPEYKRFPIELAFRGGLRYGELAALKKQDLDIQRGVVHVRRALSLARDGEDETVKEPKGRRARPVVIGKEFADELFRWSLLNTGQLLVPSPRGGRLAKTSLRRWLKEACQGANVRVISPHGLRHSFGAWAAAQGYSQAQISKLLRHRQVSTSARYTHVEDAVKMAGGLWDRLDRR